MICRTKSRVVVGTSWTTSVGRGSTTVAGGCILTARIAILSPRLKTKTILMMNDHDDDHFARD